MMREREHVAKTFDLDRLRECAHKPQRLYSWYAKDGTLVVCCCECGAVLKGGAS